MGNCLLDFWNRADLLGAPFVHPSDEINDSLRIELTTYAEFQHAFEDGPLSNNALHLGLIPQPYFGNLNDAEILILFANPGLAAFDYYAEENCPAYRQELIDVIRQKQRMHPFLDPKWAWTSGFQWWERKFRPIAKRIAKEKYGDNYGLALSALAEQIASIELVPYHSFISGAPANMASSEAARKFVRSIGSGRTVIVTRCVERWGLEDAKNVIKYPNSHARSASLGVNTLGGAAILRHFECTP